MRYLHLMALLIFFTRPLCHAHRNPFIKHILIYEYFIAKHTFTYKAVSPRYTYNIYSLISFHNLLKILKNIFFPTHYPPSLSSSSSSYMNYLFRMWKYDENFKFIIIFFICDIAVGIQIERPDGVTLNRRSFNM